MEMEMHPPETVVMEEMINRKSDIYIKYARYNVLALLLGILSPYTAPWFIAFIGFQYIAQKAKTRDLDSIKSNALARPYLLILFSIIASDIYSPDFFEMMATLGLIVPYIAYGLYTGEVFDESFAMRMLKLMIFTSVPIGVYGIIQTIFANYGILFHLSGGRVVSTFANPNLYALYLSIIMFLTLGYTFYVKSEKEQWALTIVFCINAVNLYLTNSRTALCSALLASIFFFILCGKKHIAHTLFISVFIVIMISFVYPQLIPRYAVLDDNLQTRKDIWELAAWGIRYSPVMGRGFLSFMEFSAIFGINQPHAHNIVLNTWFEWGILGVIGIVWYVAVLFKRGLSALRDSEYKPIIAGILSAVIAAFIQSMTDNPVINIQTAFMFILMSSILMAITRKRHLSVQSKKGIIK